MSKDLNQYNRETDRRLIFGGIILLVVVGGGLIYLVYGSGAAISGILCAGIGLFPVLIIILLFWLLDRYLRNRNE
jgi:hypothetical protein